MRNEYLHGDVLNSLMSMANIGADETIQGNWTFDSILTVNDTLFMNTGGSYIREEDDTLKFGAGTTEEYILKDTIIFLAVHLRI